MDVQVAAPPTMISSTRQCVCGGWTRYVVCQYCGTTDPAAVAAGLISMTPLVRRTPEEIDAAPTPASAFGNDGAAAGWEPGAQPPMPTFAGANPALPPTTFAEAQFGAAPSAAAVYASTADAAAFAGAFADDASALPELEPAPRPIAYTEPIPGWTAEPVAAPPGWASAPVAASRSFTVAPPGETTSPVPATSAFLVPAGPVTQAAEPSSLPVPDPAGEHIGGFGFAVSSPSVSPLAERHEGADEHVEPGSVFHEGDAFGDAYAHEGTQAFGEAHAFEDTYVPEAAPAFQDSDGTGHTSSYSDVTGKLYEAEEDHPHDVVMAATPAPPTSFDLPPGLTFPGVPTAAEDADPVDSGSDVTAKRRLRRAKKTKPAVDGLTAQPEDVAGPPDEVPLDAPSRSRRLPRWALPAVAVVAVAGGGAYYYSNMGTGDSSTPVPVVVHHAVRAVKAPAVATVPSVIPAGYTATGPAQPFTFATIKKADIIHNRAELQAAGVASGSLTTYTGPGGIVATVVTETAASPAQAAALVKPTHVPGYTAEASKGTTVYVVHTATGRSPEIVAAFASWTAGLVR